MDIAIVWDEVNFRGDWSINSGDLAIDPGGIRSAVLLSRFTWRRASPDYVPVSGAAPDRHGWWADTYEPSLLGSRLWQLDRSKKYNSALLANQARDYCREALQWLVDDGVVDSITVNVGWIAPTALGIEVTAIAPQSPPQTWNFRWAWQNTTGAPAPVRPPGIFTLDVAGSDVLDSNILG